MPGDPIGPNQIVSSNSLALGAFVVACGGVPLQLGIAPDTPDSVRRLAEGARGADLLVTTGGASVGEHDLVKDALGVAGLELDFWQIAMRPGKPLMVGRYRDARMVGLPGNPVSTLVCALIFLKPAIERLSGLDPVAEPPAGHSPCRSRRTPPAGLSATPRAPPASSRPAFGKQDSPSVAARIYCLVGRPRLSPAA
jgi:molybdopterin molybdotransferase